jgi:hypothetical protein
MNDDGYMTFVTLLDLGLTNRFSSTVFHPSSVQILLYSGI